MSTIFRKTLVCLVAVFAMSAMVASAAFADVGQELTKATASEKFTGKSGIGKLSVPKAGITITCETDANGGQTSATKPTTNVEKVVVTFKNCVAEKGGAKCKVNSPGAKEGELITSSLKGELSEVSKGTVDEAAALLLEPEEAAKGFVTIAKTECNPETKVTGSIAGEVTQPAKPSKTVNVDFKVSAGKQAITQVERSVGDALVTTKLSAFGFEATEETLDENTFPTAVELTNGG
jgi:hypothetical protein